ncbi:hypothetical protein D4765_10120 [Subtercola vilae]|uniref:Uncharacterized protein n=1 Tax=Subtercola vilae TaxID=2056433 RepID=A0A4T2C1F5_9MICO|nr:SOS response-associated peptidase family protein [Subtercola vilae]TIH36136.1 hypothetical protein D4765_10120 [Subtercola vilae]
MVERMCGRFAIDGKVNETITAYVHAGGDPQEWRPADWVANYNVAPTNPVIVRDRVDEDSGELRCEVDWDATWDFRPPWLKTPAPQINARIENLTSSNLWKKAFLGRRVIVPMLGYLRVEDDRGQEAALLHPLRRRLPLGGRHLRPGQDRRRLECPVCHHHPRGPRRIRRDPRPHAGVPHPGPVGRMALAHRTRGPR